MAEGSRYAVGRIHACHNDPGPHSDEVAMVWACRFCWLIE